MLQRTGAQFEIELPVTVTPLGAVARLEHPLTNFEGEQGTTVGALPKPSGASPPIAHESAKPSPSPPNSISSARQLAEIEVDLANDGDSADSALRADTKRAAA